MDDLRLIVGLGNPGPEYAKTRHNAGFMVAERVAGRLGGQWRTEPGFKARCALGRLGTLRVLCCEPQTYMNLSGEAVAKVSAFYRVPLQALLVVVDDADLELGRIRLRADGSSGGHHGLESVERHLGTRGYARLRVGIGREAGREAAREITGRVLGRFAANEQALVEAVLERAADQALCWAVDGVMRAMNLYNGVAIDPGNPEKN